MSEAGLSSVRPNLLQPWPLHPHRNLKEYNPTRNTQSNFRFFYRIAPANLSVLSPLFLYIYFCTSQIVYLTWPWHFNLRISICLSQFVYLHWRWYFNLCIYFCTVPSGGKSLFSERTGGRCLKKETKERPKHEHKSRARRISETCVIRRIEQDEYRATKTRAPYQKLVWTGYAPPERAE